MLLRWSLPLSQDTSPGGAQQIRKQDIAELIVVRVNVEDHARNKLSGGCRVKGRAVGRVHTLITPRGSKTVRANSSLTRIGARNDAELQAEGSGCARGGLDGLR